MMDQIPTVDNLRFVGQLSSLVDTHPIGVASAFSALHERLETIVKSLGSNLGEELVSMIATIRSTIGQKVSEDYHSKLKELRHSQDRDYLEQRGFVAARLLTDLKPEPFKSQNDMTLDQLEWIIPSLDEASLAAENPTCASRYIPELRQAHSLKLALSGKPETRTEVRFLEIYEVLLARLIGCVPASTLFGFWASLKPKTEAGRAYHERVAGELTDVPPQAISETAYIESGLVLLESLAETVAASSKDWEVRALSQQITEYIKDASSGVYPRIQNILSKDTGTLENWKIRCEQILGRVNMLHEHISPYICRHYELGLEDLSAYNFNDGYSSAIVRVIRYTE